MKTKATTTKAITDEALASVMQGGNAKEKEAALAEIYGRWKDKIHITFFRGLTMHTDKDETVKDLVQNVFIKVFANIGSFRQESAKFSTWIYTIAHNELIDFKRKQRYEIIHYEGLKVNNGGDSDRGEMVFQIACTNKIADEAIIAEQKAESVRNTIVAALKNDQMRDMVMFRFFDEMSYEEIAERMDIPKGTVKSTLSRAKDMIKQHMEKKSMHA